ncbi:hypothetical protein BU15DRAFT_55870 [Melanogaster broomeanus]|nr:hypothetical protein BU15DRAFT_55870 [Melanogaster broomeanus]
MEIRWNTTYAEMDRGIKLKLAVNYWVDQLDNGLRGKKKTAATRKKKKWHISHSEWELLERLCIVLQDLYDATLDFSVSGVPTITKPLPLYKFIEQKLQRAIEELTEDEDPHNLTDALTAGLEKLRKHLRKSLDSHYPLLGAVLHPSIRLAYFKDGSKWSNDIPARAETLLEHLYMEYADDSAQSNTPASHVTPRQPTEVPKSIFDQAITMKTDSTTSGTTLGGVKQSELSNYFGGAYPCKNQADPLGWWKVRLISI